MLDSRSLLEGVSSGLGDYRRRLVIELLLLLLTLRREELLLALGTYGRWLLLVKLLLRLETLRRRSLVVHGLRVEGCILAHRSSVLRALVVDHALGVDLDRDSDRNRGGAGRDGITVESGAAVAAHGNAVDDERDEEE